MIFMHHIKEEVKPKNSIFYFLEEAGRQEAGKIFQQVFSCNFLVLFLNKLKLCDEFSVDALYCLLSSQINLPETVK